MTHTTFDKLLKSERYQELLKNLSEDEKEVIVKSLRKLFEDFENSVIQPLKILKNKNN